MKSTKIKVNRNSSHVKNLIFFLINNSKIKIIDIITVIKFIINDPINRLIGNIASKKLKNY